MIMRQVIQQLDEGALLVKSNGKYQVFKDNKILGLASFNIREVIEDYNNIKEGQKDVNKESEDQGSGAREEKGVSRKRKSGKAKE